MNDYNRAFAREMLRQNGLPSATDAEAEAFLAQHRAVAGRGFEILAASTDAVRKTHRNGNFTIEVSVRDHAVAQAGVRELQRRRSETADAIAAVRQKVLDNSELEQFVLGVGLGVKSGAVGTYQAVRHPVDTAEAVGTMVMHPSETYDKLKAALGDKWEEFERADAPKRARMLGELTGETAVAIVGTKGAGLAVSGTSKVAATALKATAPGRALAAEMAATAERVMAHPTVQKVGTAANEIRREALDRTAKAAEKIVERPGVQAAIKTAEKMTAPVVTTVKNATEGLSERNRLTTLGKEMEKLDDLDATKRADFGNKPPRLFGGKRVPQATLNAYVEEMKKHNIKVVLDADATIKKYNKDGYAAFDFENKRILLPKGVTEFGLFHENQHVLHYLEVGEDAYKAAGTLAREERVYQVIMENKHLFNPMEIKAATDYMTGIRINEGARQNMILKGIPQNE